MKVMVPKDAPQRGVLRTECSYRHAAGQEIKFIQIELGMQTLSETDKRYLEHELVKGGHAIDCMGRSAGPGTLHRYYSSSLSLYRACSTSHVWMAPGDIFQHCASARDFVRIFVIWSKERSSPTQIHENHGPEKMLRSGVSSTLSVATDTPMGWKFSSYK